MKSVLYHITTFSGDSLKITGSFFQKHPVVIRPTLLENPEGHLVFYVLFGLLVFLALIRFLYPSTFKSVFYFFVGGISSQDSDKYTGSGWAVPLFLTINFLTGITLVILIWLIKSGYFPEKAFSRPQLWGIIAGGVLSFYLFIQFTALLSGFIFNTMKQALQQIKNTALWIYVSGLVLTPLLLIYFYSGSTFIAEMMLVILALLLIFKWVQTIRIGLAFHNFHLLHLFLYLCAVEILPLLIWIKVSIP